MSKSMSFRIPLLCLALFFGVFFLIGGISFIHSYNSGLQDIQVKKRLVQQGVVTCDNQQMQPTDFCAETVNGQAIPSLATDNSINLMGHTYEQQRQVNIQDIQAEEQNNQYNLIPGIIEPTAGVVLLLYSLFLIKRMRAFRKQRENVY
jgi:glycyl-tRNA synthetase (class II)